MDPVYNLTQNQSPAGAGQEIDELQSCIHTLEIQQNSLSAISTLPDEILSAIFLEYGIRMEDPYLGKWTKLLLVCRRWRQVCLDHAALWSFVSVCPSMHQRLDDRLRLSAGFPLSLRLTLTQDEYETSLHRHILHSHSDRIQNLELNDDGAKVSPETIMTGVDALPALERIKLVGFGDRARLWGMSESLQRSVAPNLRSLTLRYSQCSSGWDLFSNLTSLWLKGYACSESRLPTLDNVLAIIARSPRLVTLTWDVQLPNGAIDIDRTTTAPFATIELPYLAHLDLRAYAECTRLIIDTLRMPITAVVELDVAQICDENTIRPILAPVRNHFRRADGPLFTFIDVIHDDEQSYFQLRAFTHAPLPKYGDDKDGAKIEPTALFDLSILCGDQAETRSVLLEVVHALPIDPSSVSIGASEDFEPETWRALASALPQLHSIRMDLSLTQVVVMLEGIMEMLDHGTRGVSGPCQKQLESRVRSHPSHLVVGYRRHLSLRGIEPEWAPNCLKALRGGLQRFYDRTGERWKVLEFATRGQRDGALELEPYRDDLFELVEALIIDGVPYVPKAVAEQAVEGQSAG